MAAKTERKKNNISRHRRSSSSESGYNTYKKNGSLSNLNNLHQRRNSVLEGEESLLKNIITFNDETNLHPSKLLQDLIEHLFDNVFINLPESIKKSILVELWRLVPLEITLTMKPKNSQWSKKAILTAFEAAEMSFEGTAEEALQALINFKAEPFVTDLVIDFISTNYPDGVTVLRAADRILRYPSTCRLRTAHSSSSIHNVLTKLNNNEYPILFESQRPSSNPWFIKFTRRCILCSVASVILVCLICYSTAFYLHHINAKTDRILESFRVNGSLSYSNAVAEKHTHTSYSPVIPKPMKENKMYNLTVHSYEQYKTEMIKLSYDKEVSLTISVDKPLDWPNDAQLGNTLTITQLTMTGSLSIKILRGVLKQMQNVKILTIRNTNHHLCHINQVDDYVSEKVNLSNVRQFSLEDFNDCTNFYKKFSEFFVIKNLEGFKLANSLITKRNSPYIQAIIRNARSSLISLEFPKSTWLTPLFDGELGTLLKTEYVQMDFLKDNSDTHVVFISREMSNIFPNLKSFVSNAGFVSWNQFFNMSDCKELIYLKVGLGLPERQDRIDVSVFYKTFPLLQTLDLELRFRGVDDKKGCSVEGIEMIEKHVNFSYRSNCHDKRDLENIQKILEENGESIEV